MVRARPRSRASSREISRSIQRSMLEHPHSRMPLTASKEAQCKSSEPQRKRPNSPAQLPNHAPPACQKNFLPFCHLMLERRKLQCRQGWRRLDTQKTMISHANAMPCRRKRKERQVKCTPNFERPKPALCGRQSDQRKRARQMYSGNITASFQGKLQSWAPRTALTGSPAVPRCPRRSSQSRE